MSGQERRAEFRVALAYRDARLDDHRSPPPDLEEQEIDDYLLGEVIDGGLDSHDFGMEAVTVERLIPHPLDNEEIAVTVFHVPTGLQSTAQDDPGTPVDETYQRALDDLLSQVEQSGGG